MARFSLKGLPANAVVESATLEMTVYEQGGGDYQLCRLTRKWVPSQVTWNKASSSVSWTTGGGDHATTPDATWPGSTVPAKGSVMRFNVTGTVGAWARDTTTNFGWLFRTTVVRANDNGSSYGMRFYATNWADMQAARPKLVVTYSTGTTGAEQVVTSQVSQRGTLTFDGQTMRLASGHAGARVEFVGANGSVSRRLTAGSDATVRVGGLAHGVYAVRVAGAPAGTVYIR